MARTQFSPAVHRPDRIRPRQHASSGRPVVRRSRPHRIGRGSRIRARRGVRDDGDLHPARRGDRRPLSRRALMLFADSFADAPSSRSASLFIVGHVSIIPIIVLSGVIGIGAALFNPAADRPDAVSREVRASSTGERTPADCELDRGHRRTRGGGHAGRFGRDPAGRSSATRPRSSSASPCSPRLRFAEVAREAAPGLARRAARRMERLLVAGLVQDDRVRGIRVQPAVRRLRRARAGHLEAALRRRRCLGHRSQPSARSAPRSPVWLR